MVTVAVVILNWNGKSLLEKFLPTVLAYSSNATIYVADNASTDESVCFVSQNFPQVKIIRNAINGGYAKGYNDALQHLSEDIFVLLNSDVEVTENWLKPVINEFIQNPNLAAAQPKILDYNKKNTFEYAGAAGGFIDKYGFPYCRGRIFESLEEDMGQYDTNVSIFWASGACLFIRSQDFKNIGGFDEDYFAHQEEIDLCWRLHSANKEVLCIGTSKVYHVGGATLDASHPKKTFYNFRNSLFNLYKNIAGVKSFGIIFIRLCMDGMAGIRFLLKGSFSHCFAIIQAHFSFYKNIGKMRRKRRKYSSNKSYFTIHSIVIQYFLFKNRNFDRLKQR